MTLLINVRAPTLVKWNVMLLNFKRLHLTSKSLTWDPSTALYEDQEASNLSWWTLLRWKNDAVVAEEIIEAPPE